MNQRELTLNAQNTTGNNINSSPVQGAYNLDSFGTVVLSGASAARQFVSHLVQRLYRV